MKLLPTVSKLVASLGFLVLASTSSAQLIGIAGSTAAPAKTLGGYTMTSFADDTRPDFGLVNKLSTPIGGDLSFGLLPVAHFEVGEGWLTWSNGYSGDIYFSNGLIPLKLTLPTATKAFYFYAESNDRGNHKFTVKSGNVTLKETVNGNGGAELFGFYAEGNAFLSSITISSNDITGFAIGEFGIAGVAQTAEADAAPLPVPEPSTYALAGAVGLCGLVLVRRLRRKIR